MSVDMDQHGPQHSEALLLYALDALPAAEARDLKSHVSGCAACRREMEALRPVVQSFAAWPTDVVRPAGSLWPRLAQRIATESGGEPLPAPETRWVEPAWKEVAPGICVKLLAADMQRDRVSMLVRLDPDTHYPPHTHRGREELHLLEGELWINERKFYPGDYYRAELGSADERVWSETGCTCVLITSTRDALT
jgi:anti-sigma factor ChrR (cupin superfamily)